MIRTALLKWGFVAIFLSDDEIYLRESSQGPEDVCDLDDKDKSNWDAGMQVSNHIRDYGTDF